MWWLLEMWIWLNGSFRIVKSKYRQIDQSCQNIWHILRYSDISLRYSGLRWWIVTGGLAPVFKINWWIELVRAFFCVPPPLQKSIDSKRNTHLINHLKSIDSKRNTHSKSIDSQRYSKRNIHSKSIDSQRYSKRNTQLFQNFFQNVDHIIQKIRNWCQNVMRKFNWFWKNKRNLK